jgi:non-heme chloroperoxidase
MLSQTTAAYPIFRNPSAATRRTTLAFGPTLDYVDRGNTRSIPVVFLHGYTDSWLSFAMVLPHLPSHIRSLALSQRGHGDSDRPVAGYHPGDFAADLGGFLDALGIERAVVVGHAMGSQIALRFALARPERVLGLALIGGFPTLADNPTMAQLRDDVARLSDPVDADFVRAFQGSSIARPCADSFFDLIVEESLKVPARIWREALGELMADDVSAELRHIRAPTLVAWGDRDSLVPRAAQEVLAADIPCARLVIHHGSGHALHWDDPEGFASELATFVDTVTARD